MVVVAKDSSGKQRFVGSAKRLSHATPYTQPSHSPQSTVIQSKSSKASSDRQLLLDAQSGDEAAMRTFYRKHADAVFRHLSYTLGADDGAIDDALQQTFLSALKSAHRFREESNIRRWLFSIASRRAVDEIRSRERLRRWQRRGEQASNTISAHAYAQPNSGPETRTLALNSARHILSLLDPECCEAFVWVEIEGHTLEEASKALGVKLSTLHARVARARQRVKQLIEKEGV